MAITNGRYLTGTLLLQYIQGTRTDPANPRNFNQAVTGTPDDNLLSDLIVEAEAFIDGRTGTGFDQQTFTLVEPIQVFVDGNGWLQLWARERGPITAVTAVQVREIQSGGTTWQTVTWDASNDIILPPYYSFDTYPRPSSWKVRIWPSPALFSSASNEILARWTYTGGFATIPESLSSLTARLATHIYKLREAPAGRVTNQPLGSMFIPSNFPPALIEELNNWTPKYG